MGSVCFERAHATKKVVPRLSLAVQSAPLTLGGEGAKSYDGEKAWSSTNHSILSDDLYSEQKVLAIFISFNVY